MASTYGRERPTKADIYSLLSQREAVLSAMHSDMRDADDWLHAHERNSRVLAEVRQGLDASFQFDCPPYAYIDVNRAINSTSTAEVPQVNHTFASWYKDRHPTTAEKDEHANALAAQSIMRRVVTRAGRNPILDAQWQQMGLGMGCLYYPMDYASLGEPPDVDRGTPEGDDLWAAYEHKRMTTLPHRVESLHPTWVFPDLDGDPPEDIIIKRPVSLAAMQRRYPDKAHLFNMGGNGNETKTAWYLEYVSRAYYACYVNEVPVTPNADDEGVAVNYRGFVWAEVIWSGLGKIDDEGRMDRQGIGIVQRGIHNYRRRTWDLNWLKLIKIMYAPKLIIQAPSVEEGMAETRDFDPSSPGMAALANAQMKYLEPPSVPAALLRDMDKSEQEAEAYAGPGTLSGEHHSEPASKYSARLEQARGPYRTPKANMEQALANMIRNMMADLKHEPDLKDGYQHTWKERDGYREYTRSVYIKPNQIHLEASMFEVDLSPLTPQDKAFQTQEAIAKRDAEFWSLERAMKQGGEIEDPPEEMSRIMAEKILFSPEVLQAAAQALIMKILPPQPMAAPPAQGGMGGENSMGSQPAPAPMPQPGVPPQSPVTPMAGSPQEAQMGAAGMFSMPMSIAGGMNGAGGGY